MIAAGINCVRVDTEQVEWVKNRNVFYWGIDAAALGYPECLYRSNYLGPAIFMDEPAVCTRDHVLRPKLEADPAFRKALTPQVILLPPGYNLGHVEMGRGNLWGLGELNLERHNREGTKYRTVMHNFFTLFPLSVSKSTNFHLKPQNFFL